LKNPESKTTETYIECI